MSKELNPEAFRKLVRDTAYSTSKNFPAYVEVSDVEQELYLWLYSKRTWIISQMEDDVAKATSAITAIMRKVAFDHCNKEKAATEGYDEEDVYRYRVPAIKRLLVDVFDYLDWQSFGSRGDGQPSSKPQANETGDRVAELIDVKIGLGKLNDDQYNVIVWKYKYSWSDQNVADTLEISEEAAKKRHQRALVALQKQLGYKDPSEVHKAPERRSVRSNAASRATASNSYDGA